MFFKMVITGSGSAMQNRSDVAELMLEVRNRVLAGEQMGSIRDLNGNHCGYFKAGDEQ